MAFGAGTGDAETAQVADDGLPGTSRLEAFSDGVLALAITLLILDVKVPEGEIGSLGEALTAQWPPTSAMPPAS